MSSNYIVKFRKETNKEFQDGYLEIFNSKINITTEKNIFDPSNIIILSEYIFNISVSFDDDLFESKINNIIVKFDSNSSSAWTNYKLIIYTIINTKDEIEKYPSGNVMCIGNILYKNDKRVLHGNGTVFYDTPTNNIMYIGEFENGIFDGAGEFFSMDGYVSIRINNIVNGIPKHNGEIKINYPNYKLIRDINFNTIWTKLNIISDEEITTLVLSNNFVDTITKIVWTNLKSLDDTQFEIMSLNEKCNLLFSKIKIINQQIIQHNQIIKQTNYDNFIQFSIFLVLLIILITCYFFILLKIY
jgi:hypothetical protein